MNKFQESENKRRLARMKKVQELLKKGWSFREICKKTGLSVGQIHNYKLGRGTNPKKRCKLCHQLSIKA